MPTSSKRLHARANAFMEAATAMEILSSQTDDALEAEEYERLGLKLWAECHRLTELADKREQKEQGT